MISVFCIFVLGYPLFSSVGAEFQSPVLIMLLFDHGPNSACICSRVYHGSTMKFRASWFSENSDRGIAISVSILSSGFSDALFVCFWWLVTLERLFAICIRTFLILQVLHLKPPTWTSRIRIFWLWSEFPACYPKTKCKSEYSDCDQNFLIVIQKNAFFSDCDQNCLIVIRIFWSWSEFIKKMQIRIFWLRSEFSDCYPKKCKSEYCLKVAESCETTRFWSFKLDGFSSQWFPYN